MRRPPRRSSTTRRARRFGERLFGCGGQLESQPDLFGAGVTFVQPPGDRGEQRRQLGPLSPLRKGAAQVEGRGGQGAGISFELHGRPQVWEPGGRGSDPRLDSGCRNEQSAAHVVVEVISQHATQALQGELLLARGEELVGASLELLNRPGVPDGFGAHQVPRHRRRVGLPAGQHLGRPGVCLGPDRRRHLRVDRRPLQRVAEPEGIVATQQPEIDHRVDRRDDLLWLDFGELGH